MKPSELIESHGWTQEEMCRDSEGNYSACPSDPEQIKEGMCFCIYGAFTALGMYKEYGKFSASCAICGIPVIAFNDKEGRTKEEVVEFLQEHGY